MKLVILQLQTPNSIEMVNFNLGKEMWKENWVTDKNQVHDLPNTELEIHHLYSLITTHDDFDSADPSNMQDACHVWAQLNGLALQEFTLAQWILSTCLVFQRQWVWFLSEAQIFSLSRHLCQAD